MRAYSTDASMTFTDIQMPLSRSRSAKAAYRNKDHAMRAQPARLLPQRRRKHLWLRLTVYGDSMYSSLLSLPSLSLSAATVLISEGPWAVVPPKMTVSTLPLPHPCARHCRHNSVRSYIWLTWDDLLAEFSTSLAHGHGSRTCPLVSIARRSPQDADTHAQAVWTALRIRAVIPP